MLFFRKNVFVSISFWDWYLKSIKLASCYGGWFCKKSQVKSSPRHYALGSHEGLYGQCLNLVSVVRSNLECSYTDSPGRDTSPSQVLSKQCLYSFAAE